MADTLLINIISPLAEFVVFLGIRLLKRCLDQKSLCPCDRRNTRTRTIQQFEAIYSGPAFFVHYRLAFIVNIVWVAFLFGPGMPVLFLIALAGLILNVISERLRMAYSYTKPPMYDNRLSQSTLTMLGIAPLLYVIAASWLYSNQQVFRNKVPYLDSHSVNPIYGHKIADLFSQVTPASPFVWGAIGGIIYVSIVTFRRKCCNNDTGKENIDDLVILESLQPFFSMLKDVDRDFWFREEKVARERLGLKRIRGKNFK